MNRRAIAALVGLGVAGGLVAECTEVDPAWSPDGSKIVFAVAWPDFPAYGMSTINADGTGAFFNLVTAFHYEYRNPTWSPDGSKIAFISSRDVVFQIYVMKADGTGLTRLKSNATDVEPDWR